MKLEVVMSSGDKAVSAKTAKTAPNAIAMTPWESRANKHTVRHDVIMRSQRTTAMRTGVTMWRIQHEKHHEDDHLSFSNDTRTSPCRATNVDGNTEVLDADDARDEIADGNVKVLGEAEDETVASKDAVVSTRHASLRAQPRLDKVSEDHDKTTGTTCSPEEATHSVSAFLFDLIHTLRIAT